MQEEQEKTAEFETEDLEAGWAQRYQPRFHARVAVGAKTDLGRVRENNEDKFDFFEPGELHLLAQKGRVYAVADGMGGHTAGQVAAELALNHFIRAYFRDTSSAIPASLTRAVRVANAHVVDVARNVAGRSGMGATLTAVVLRDDSLYIAQVGDSRCYRLRAGRLEQLTQDHSWVAEQVRAGNMSEVDAEQSPFRNVITRSMGGGPDVEPDVAPIELELGDRFLLCSDGLSGMVPEAEITQLLGAGSASDAAWRLVDRANEYGGRDNITALVLDVYELAPWDSYETGAIPLMESAQTTSTEAPAARHSPPAAPAAGTAPEDPTDQKAGRRGLFGLGWGR